MLHDALSFIPLSGPVIRDLLMMPVIVVLAFLSGVGVAASDHTQCIADNGRHAVLGNDASCGSTGEAETDDMSLLQTLMDLKAPKGGMEAPGVTNSKTPDQALSPVDTALAANSSVSSKSVASNRGHRDLVEMHVPYNFGHTIELVALVNETFLDAATQPEGTNGSSEPSGVSFEVTWDQVSSIKKDGAEVWGHLNPDLNVKSEATGCNLYYTPQKYWPKEIAEQYFGNKTVFGVLRDPYERLVAFFRGGFDGYGGSYPEFQKTCDVDGAVNQMMQTVINGNDTFTQDCTFVPQAEYFEGPYGITLPIDNRLFPQSMNEAFENHSYDFHIRQKDIQHVNGCNDIWAGNLSVETKQLVKQFYARDFDLICKHFGYCDREENTCLTQVHYMCPSTLFEWDDKESVYRVIGDGSAKSGTSTILIVGVVIGSAILLAVIAAVCVRTLG